MRKLDRDALLADGESLRRLLADLSQDDALGRISLESRLTAVEEELSLLEEDLDTTGGVALMFGGLPVLGSRAIDAEFTAKALRRFHSLVQAKVAFDEFGSLGSRGPIPSRGTGVDLAITEVVRGSMGFLLEENTQHLELAETVVKRALDDVSGLIVNTASDNADDFERAVDTLDPRLLASLRRFFRTLDDNHATLHIVEGERDAVLDAVAVQRARERVDTMQITENESESIEGELLGLLPESRRFEMKLRATGEIIRGPVAAAFAEPYLELIERPHGGVVGRQWRAKMRIREIRERNKPARQLYYLVGLLEQISGNDG